MIGDLYCESYTIKRFESSFTCYVTILKLRNTGMRLLKIITPFEIISSCLNCWLKFKKNDGGYFVIDILDFKG